MGMTRNPMSEDDAIAYLRGVGQSADAAIDLAEAALHLASFGRPRVPLARYREHLAALAGDVAAALGREPEAPAEALARRIEALKAALVDKNGYRGEGLAFPGHFLVRLAHDGARAIIDPFNDAAVLGPTALRELIKSAVGAEAELAPEHHAPVDNRAVLLRLHNNIKSRLIQNDQIAEAVEVIEQMQLFAPGEIGLWREAGLCHARLDNLGAAIAALETFIAS